MVRLEEGSPHLPLYSLSLYILAQVTLSWVENVSMSLPCSMKSVPSTTPTFLVVSTYNVSTLSSCPESGPELRALSSRSCFSLQWGNIWGEKWQTFVSTWSDFYFCWLRSRWGQESSLLSLLSSSSSSSPPGQVSVPCYSSSFTLSAPGSESKWRTNCVSLQCSQICCLEFTSFFALKCKRIFEIFSIEPMLQQSNWCRKYKTFFFFQLAGVWLSYLYVDVTDLRFIGPFGWQNVILGVVNNGPDFRQNKTLSPSSLSLGSL